MHEHSLQTKCNFRYATLSASARAFTRNINNLFRSQAWRARDLHGFHQSVQNTDFVSDLQYNETTLECTAAKADAYVHGDVTTLINRQTRLRSLMLVRKLSQIISVVYVFD